MSSSRLGRCSKLHVFVVLEIYCVNPLTSLGLKVQELHLDLVAFCSELKNSDGDGNLEMLGSAELEQKLELLQRRLSDKKQSLQTLQDHINNPAAHRKK